MIARSWFVSCSISLLVLAGCSPKQDHVDAVTSAAALTPTQTVRDGITILSHPADALDKAPQMTLDTAPIAVLGGAGGDAKYDMSAVDHVVLLSDGRYATFGEIGAQVMIFDAQGRGQHVWGGVGEGPGFIMRANGMLHLPGDTLFLLDDGNRRRDWILPDRGVVRDQPFQPMPPPYYSVMPRGFLHDGRIVASDASGRNQTVDSTVRWPVPLIVMNHVGDSARIVDSIPGWEVTRVETNFRGRKGVETMPLRMGRYSVVSQWDSVIATTSNSQYAIDLRNAEGRVVRRITVPVPRRPVTATMRTAQIEWEKRRFSAMGGGEGMVDPAESQRLITAVPFADSMPLIGELSPADANTLWVVDAVARSDSSWSAVAFRPDGAIIGRLHVNNRDWPHAFQGDKVILRHEDDDGVISFRVYRIVPGHQRASATNSGPGLSK